MDKAMALLSLLWRLITWLARSKTVQDAAKDAARDEVTDAKPQPELTKELNDEIDRSRWGRIDAGLLLMVAMAAALTLSASGCGQKTVYIPDGEPVRIREPVHAKVWTLNAAGEPVAGEMLIPEGWYALPRKRAGASAPNPAPNP